MRSQPTKEKQQFDDWWAELSILAKDADWGLSEQRCYFEEWNEGLTPVEVIALEMSYADNDDPG